MKKILLILSFGSIILLVPSCRKETPIISGNGEQVINQGPQFAATAPTRDDNMGLGNPSNAIANTSSPANYLMVKKDYTLSYNRDKGIPNWVCWHLSSAWKGNAPRIDKFKADASLPSGWKRVSPADYTNSGFDKGHMCCSEDRDFNAAENEETFLMTNMVPQSPNNNQQTWRSLEAYCQALAATGNELYICAGPNGQGGTGGKGPASSLGAGSIVVPASVWKVIVVLPVGASDVKRITKTTRVIAVIMPNDQVVKSKPWGDYRVSVDQVEALTGYDFLTAVSTTIQGTIEANVDTGPTN